MSTFDCTFEEFKQACKELTIASKILDADGLRNGAKMLGLLYLNMNEEMWQTSAAYALQITYREIGIERLL